MIKSVIQVNPTYTMATFKLSSTVCKNLDKLVKKFWWSSKPKGIIYMALNSWDDICIPKFLGSLGFRHFLDINVALLAKLACKIASEEDAWWIHILRAKYPRGQSFFQYKEKPRASIVWKSIISARQWILKRACFHLENRGNINIWSDLWVLWLAHRIPNLERGWTLMILSWWLSLRIWRRLAGMKGW